MILVFFPRAFQGLVFFVNLKHCSAKTRMWFQVSSFDFHPQLKEHILPINTSDSRFFSFFFWVVSILNLRKKTSIPFSTQVQYLSRSTGQWIPAVVQGHVMLNSELHYHLDVQEAAPFQRVKSAAVTLPDELPMAPTIAALDVLERGEEKLRKEKREVEVKDVDVETPSMFTFASGKMLQKLVSDETLEDSIALRVASTARPKAKAAGKGQFSESEGGTLPTPERVEPSLQDLKSFLERCGKTIELIQSENLSGWAPFWTRNLETWDPAWRGIVGVKCISSCCSESSRWFESLLSGNGETTRTWRFREFTSGASLRDFQSEDLSGRATFWVVHQWEFSGWSIEQWNLPKPKKAWRGPWPRVLRQKTFWGLPARDWKSRYPNVIQQSNQSRNGSI